jgi:hypothetical protein
MTHIFEIGTRAWQPDVTEGWVASTVTDKQIQGDKVKLIFDVENGEVCPYDSTISTWGEAMANHALCRLKLSRRPSLPYRTARTRTSRP